jgi:flagellar hook-length control protein FliK
LTSVGMASASPVSFAHAVQTAAASSSGSSVPVDPNAVIEQVVKAMTMRTASDGTSEIRLHLEPEQLGSVTLRLTVNGSSVSATAIAQNPDVHGLLTSHQHQLERSLAESGLKLTSFRVDLSGQDAGTDREGDRSSGFGQRSHVRHVAADAEPDVTERSNDEPAVLSGSALGVRSYLA